MWVQTTIEDNFSLEGKGRRTGKNIRISFFPAPTNYGYKIRRMDLSGYPVIDVLSENAVITSSENGMSITENNYSINSVDMILHSLYANGVDNCLIEVDAEEFPYIDNIDVIIKKKVEETGISEKYSEKRSKQSQKI